MFPFDRIFEHFDRHIEASFRNHERIFNSIHNRNQQFFDQDFSRHQTKSDEKIYSYLLSI